MGQCRAKATAQLVKCLSWSHNDLNSISQNLHKKHGLMCACHLCTGKAETGRFLGVPGQPA